MYFVKKKKEPTKNIIVYGAPASGKSTYVKMHAEEGDVLIDLDIIQRSFQICGKSEGRKELLEFALYIRDYLYEMLEKQRIPVKTAWIIAGLPDRFERQELAKRLNAELVFIGVAKEECIKRAMNDPDRVNKVLQKQMIEKYFMNFER